MYEEQEIYRYVRKTEQQIQIREREREREGGLICL